MNTELRKNEKDNFEKDFFKLTNNTVFEKTMENLRNNRDIRLIITEPKQDEIIQYHTIKIFSENLLAIEMKRTQILINKTVYLGMSILEMSKTVTYQFSYDYVKPKYGEKVNYATWIQTASQST